MATDFAIAGNVFGALRCPGADADVHALLERVRAQVRAPLPDENRGFDRAGQRIDAERVVAAIDQRPDVARFEPVGLDGLDDRARERVAVERVVHAVDPRRVVQAAHVRVEAEERRALLASCNSAAPSKTAEP